MALFNKLHEAKKQALKEKDEITYYWKNHAEKKALRGKVSKPRQVDAGSGLCSTCSSIDIRALLATRKEEITIINPDRRPGRRVLLGLLGDILQTQCRLCMLVVHAVSEAWQMNAEALSILQTGGDPLCCHLGPAHSSRESSEAIDLDLQQGGHLRRHPIPRQGLLFVDVETAGSRSLVGEVVDEVRTEFSKLKFNSSEPVKRQYSQPQLYLPELRLLALDAHLLSYDEFGLGRVADSLDFNLIKLWYETCRGDHKCGLPEAEIPGMRLIDTHDMNVVPATSSEYAALSYVWGGAKQMQSLESNYLDLESKGSLLKHKLPKTITDAIHITRSIGIRFLWVDSLCIIQDSKTQKQQQIESMGKIYASAAVTVVAASGDHANQGLPGVSISPRLVSESKNIQGLRFMVPPPPVDKAIARAKWNTRAWCYQEWKLSRRLLIFTEAQVYFTCQSASFCESIDVFYEKDKLIDNPQDFAEGSITYDLGWQKWSWPVFKKTLHEYTPRHLTFQDDVLLACLGVMASMKADVSGSMVGGVPSSELVRGMLWQPAKNPKRRSYSRFPYPSWSWIGWVGPVNLESFSHWSEPIVRNWFYRDTSTLIPLGGGSSRSSNLNADEIKQETRQSELEDNVYENSLNQEPPLSQCNGADFPDDERFTASAEVVGTLKSANVVLVPSYDDPKRLEYALESSLAPGEIEATFSSKLSYQITSLETKSENGVLQFYTEYASFTVSTEDIELVPRQTDTASVFEPFPPDDSTRYFRIVDPSRKNQWIGIVQLPADYFAQATTKTAKYDFVLISASKLRRRGWEEHVHKHCKTYFLDKKSIKYFFDEGNWYTLGLNVLMVRWHRGIAYRVGLGKIHYMDWDAARPQRQLITLG